MTTEFIIDANLPFKVPIWKNERFVFVLDIDPGWDDEQIWRYARETGLTIVTKDKDFLVKQAIAGAPPNVVHIKFGNLKLSAFVSRIQSVWAEVETLLQTHTIINIYLDRIEAIK